MCFFAVFVEDEWERDWSQVAWLCICVSVCEGCRNKMPQAGRLKQQTALDAGRLRPGGQRDWVLVGAPFLTHRGCLLCPHRHHRGGEEGRRHRAEAEGQLSLPPLECHSSTRVGPLPIVSFTLNYLLKDTNLSKLWEIVEDRGAWRATVHGVAEGQTPLSN